MRASHPSRLKRWFLRRFSRWYVTLSFGLWIAASSLPGCDSAGSLDDGDSSSAEGDADASAPLDVDGVETDADAPDAGHLDAFADAIDADVNEVDAGPAPTTTLQALDACLRGGLETRLSCAAGEGGLGCAAATRAHASDVFGAWTESQAVAGIPPTEQVHQAFESEALAERRVEACTLIVESAVARTLGGPQMTLFEAEDTCLPGLARASIDVAVRSMELRLACDSEECDDTDENMALVEEVASALSDGGCDPSDVLGRTASALLSEAQASAGCAFAMLYPGRAEGFFDCGPSTHRETAERGEWHQVVLDPETTNTRCADGSDFAFWIRLAPEGSPVERILLDMEGGGVCVTPLDCQDSYENRRQRWIATDMREPTRDRVATDGSSPFSDWTMVRIPYCTQDIFAGGGTVEDFAGLQVHRYGALNFRYATEYARDAVWAEMDRSSANGYLPSAVEVHLTGESAGGFGDAANYHFVADELGWTNSAMAPTGALSLGGGAVPLQNILRSKRQAWNLDAILPSYCRSDECVLGEVIVSAHAERMGTRPHQHSLVASFQYDHVQINTTLYPYDSSWINDAREAYCAMRDVPFTWFFLPANTQPNHGLNLDHEVGEQTYRAWLEAFWQAEPQVEQAVEEGALVDRVSGVDPFPCELP